MPLAGVADQKGKVLTDGVPQGMLSLTSESLSAEEMPQLLHSSF